MIAGAALEDDVLLISVRCGGSSITQCRLHRWLNLHAQHIIVVILELNRGRWFHKLALAQRVFHHGRGLVIAADEVDHDAAGRWATQAPWCAAFLCEATAVANDRVDRGVRSGTTGWGGRPCPPLTPPSLAVKEEGRPINLYFAI